MTHAPRTRQSLLLELGRHSDRAWAEFLAVYEGAILRFCRSLGLQEADALDATQEVLAAVHRRLPTWDVEAPEGRFRAWLFRVARNVALDVSADRRRRGAGGSEDQRLLAELEAPPDPGPEAFEAELRRALFAWAADEVRGQVRESTWLAFHLTAVENVDAKVAAERLGLSVGSVYTAKCRVVARIRERIDQLGDDFPPGVAPPSTEGARALRRP